MLKAKVIDVAARALGPYLGENMARAATRSHCEKLGLADGEVTPEQVGALVERLSHGLSVFVGREKTAGVIQELRKALAENAT